ncbi:FAD:protein FMN transferase [Saccharospirillum mangrovi]|uniref:FAD:protein FMN transferase n=1 Tax=Saccharospirillum mangrovi TaxID=2161747 RepID=UPI001E3BA962|nr:FAD:protein FMN transferase [Saccharospirillum mangrovi]
MGSPCELVFDSADELTTSERQSLLAGRAEALRIEQTYSRYRPDSALSRLNQSQGRAIKVDAEMALLLDFADQCYRLSDGLFDVTAGALRAVWKFGSDGQTQMPSPDAVAALLPRVGWHRLRWQTPVLELPAGMEIDLGGLAKEYAVDRVVALLQSQLTRACLVNFGGDLRVSGPRANAQPWVLGVEQPDDVRRAAAVIGLNQGALATSGDTRRFFEHQGQRYGHILNPKTGWPVIGAPRSITVAAPTCTEAGMLSTFAMLQGEGAEAFLQAQNVPFWLQS